MTLKVRAQASAKPAAARRRAVGAETPASPDPMAERLAQALRARNDLTFAPFFARAKLSPDVIQRWMDAAVEHSQQLRDTYLAAMSQGLSANDPAVQQMMRDKNAQWEATQQRILGPDVASQLEDFQRLVPANALMQEVAGGVFGTATPLTAAQGEQLTRLAANASASYQKGGTIILANVNWDSVLAQAPAILTPAQVDSLRASVMNLQVRSQLQKRVAALLQPKPGG